MFGGIKKKKKDGTVGQQLINSAIYPKINVTGSSLNGQEVKIYMKGEVTIGKVNI